MSRRTARVHGFSVIFQFPFYGQWDAAALAEAVAAYFDGLDHRPNQPDTAYINRVVNGTLDRLEQLDGVIRHFLKDWDITRISKVDLALLRLAIYEMLCENDVPMGAAVNEAVELAKLYGTDDSPAFINGVLANVARAYDGKPRGNLASEVVENG